jgi:hypothetical protein
MPQTEQKSTPCVLGKTMKKNMLSRKQVNKINVGNGIRVRKRANIGTTMSRQDDLKSIVLFFFSAISSIFSY